MGSLQEDRRRSGIVIYQDILFSLQTHLEDHETFRGNQNLITFLQKAVPRAILNSSHHILKRIIIKKENANFKEKLVIVSHSNCCRSCNYILKLTYLWPYNDICVNILPSAERD